MLALEIKARERQVIPDAGLPAQIRLTVGLKCGVGLGGGAFGGGAAGEDPGGGDLKRGVRIETLRAARERLLCAALCLLEALVIQRLRGETARADSAHEKRLLAAERLERGKTRGKRALAQKLPRLCEGALRIAARLLHHEPARLHAERVRQIFQRPHRRLREVVFDLREHIARDALACKLLLRQTALLPRAAELFSERHGAPSLLQCKSHLLHFTTAARCLQECVF